MRYLSWHYFLLPLLVCGLGAAGPTTPAGSYTDPANGFSMGVPSLGEVKQERVVLTIFQGVPEADGFTPNVTVAVDPVKTTREDYVKATADTLAKTNPKATIRSWRQLAVSGKDAEVVDYDANMAGRRLRFMQLMVFADDRVFVVTCTAPVEAFPNYLASFEKCIESFNLTH